MVFLATGTRQTALWLLCCAGLCWLQVSAARVEAQGPAIEAHANPGLVVGAKVGAGFGAFMDDFGASYVGELELGYLLPLPSPLRHALELFASGAYTAPRLEGETAASDARLPGDGIGHYTVDQRVLTITGGVLGRIPIASQLVAPYIAVGYRGFMVATKVRGSVAGQSFGTNTEQGYEHGLYAAAGVDVFLGPGALLGELQLTYARRDGYVLRDTNIGALQLLIGYRVMFGSRAGTSAEANSMEGGDSALDAQATRSAAVHGPPAQAQTNPAPAPPIAADAAPVAEATNNASGGQIRGNVRTFGGTPLRATVTVQPGDLRASTTADGRFSLDVAPGHYTVQIHAHGYKSQTRGALVDEHGVTVLNVELNRRR